MADAALELTADQTLADLGDAIPLAVGFDDPQLWSFFLSGKPRGSHQRGRLAGRRSLRWPK